MSTNVCAEYFVLSNPKTQVVERGTRLSIAPEDTKTLSNYNLLPVAYSTTSISQIFTWTSSNNNVATVSSGQITGIQAGNATITGKRLHGGDFDCVYITVIVSEIPNGTYFFRNKENSNYAKVKDGIMINNQNAVQYDFDGSNAERWIVTLDTSTGYYTIKTTNSMYYLAVIDDSSQLDKPIVIRNASVITDGMKWKFTKTTDGAYKIVPKTGETLGYVLATSTSFGTNNANLRKH